MLAVIVDNNIKALISRANNYGIQKKDTIALFVHDGQAFLVYEKEDTEQ